MDLAVEEDNTLAGRARAGELTAFDELVRRYQQPIARILYRFFPRDIGGLEDMVQEVFILAFRKLDKWCATRGDFGPWLRQLAYNRALDLLRKQKRNPLSRWLRKESGVDQDLLGSLPDNDPSPTANAASELLHALISELSPQEQVMVNLFYFENLSIAEIATALEWSQAKAKVISYRARQHLKSALEAHGYTSSQEIL